MKTRLLIAASVMAVVASLSGPGIAQDTKFTINGIDVPASELEAVKMKCDELLAGNRATALAQPGTIKTPAEAESTAEAPVDPAATAVAEAAPDAGAMAETPAAGAAAPVIDLETLTADLCEAGGFTANPPAD